MALGGLVLLVLFGVTLAAPVPRSAFLTLMVLKAVAAAAVAGGFSGYLDIKGRLAGWTVKAGGALALAVLVIWVDLKYVPEEPKIDGAHANDDPRTRINSPQVDHAGSVHQKAGDYRGTLPAGGALVNSGTFKNVKGDVVLETGNVQRAGGATAPTQP